MPSGTEDLGLILLHPLPQGRRPLQSARSQGRAPPDLMETRASWLLARICRNLFVGRGPEQGCGSVAPVQGRGGSAHSQRGMPWSPGPPPSPTGLCPPAPRSPGAPLPSRWPSRALRRLEAGLLRTLWHFRPPA